MAKPATNRMRARLAIMMGIIVFICSGIIIGRLFFLQIVDSGGYQEKALNQQLKSVSISAQRGSILDRNGNILAQSATAWNVFVAPAEIPENDYENTVNTIADGLSEILGVDRETIVKRCQNTASYYETISRKIEKDVADQITEFITETGVKGIHLETDTKRYYPYGSLASTVLGFTGSDNSGAYGLESYYNSVLSGTPGKVVSITDGKSGEMPFSYRKMYDAEDGNSLVLTIDTYMQQVLEKYMNQIVEQFNVQNRCAGIIMNPQTGEIYAMSTKPDFDPNDPQALGDSREVEKLESLEGEDYTAALQEAQFTQWRNKAISDPYEPGSVFKIITVSSALDSKAVSIDDTFNCAGSINVSGTVFHCWRSYNPHGVQTLTETLINSCNPAYVQIGQRLGGESFYRYAESYGLTTGQTTGIDLPGEATSVFLSEEALTRPGMVELGSASFGQSNKVTPIQMITAVSAAVNGGNLMVPYVVQQVVDSDGNIVSTTEPTKVRQVISEETSALVAEMCEQMVSVGGRNYAYIPGYRVGGKTGTSEKLDSDDDSKKVASFVGFAPADDPQIICLIVTDEPDVASPAGGTHAAPYVKAVLEELLPYIGLQPQYTADELALLDVTVPSVVNQSVVDAKGSLSIKSLDYTVIGDGDTVVRQVPAGGQKAPRGTKVLLYTEESGEEETLTTVPDVTNLTPQEVSRVLKAAGLNVKFSGVLSDGGDYVSVRQSVTADTQVERGTVVTVDFVNNLTNER